MAAALRVDEPAAQKRVTRAVEKLRAFFAKRGVTLTAAAIAVAVSANSVQAAPVGLAATVTAAAAKGAAVSASTLTLIKGALKIMAWTKAKMAIAIGVGVLLVVGTATIFPTHGEQGDNSYDSPEVEAFRKHLSGDAKIKLLQFSEMDGINGVQRNYLAAVDGDDFFLREYKPAEDLTALISTNNWIQENGQFQGRYFGRFRDQCWEINGPYITKSSVSDPVVNVCQLEMRTARAKIDSVLNLGGSAYTIKQGSFAWNTTNSSRFTVGLAANVSVKQIKLGREIQLTNLWGRIVAKNGRVTKLYVMSGPIEYEYETNSSIPYGVPTKITVGKKWFGYERIFRIEQLIRGHTEDSQSTFSPESKYVSADIPIINYETNGQTKLIQAGFKLSPPPLRK